MVNSSYLYKYVLNIGLLYCVKYIEYIMKFPMKF